MQQDATIAILNLPWGGDGSGEGARGMESIWATVFWDDLEFELPTAPGRRWFLAINTAQSSPHDIVNAGAEVEVTGETYRVEGRSVVVLVNRE